MEKKEKTVGIQRCDINAGIEQKNNDLFFDMLKKVNKSKYKTRMSFIAKVK